MKRKTRTSLGFAAGGLEGAIIANLKHGGKVKKTGVYKLHAGETVAPAGVDPEVARHRKHKLGHKN